MKCIDDHRRDCEIEDYRRDCGTFASELTGLKYVQYVFLV